MANIFSFTIPGAPVAKGRARSFLRQGRIAHYTPQKTAQYENLVQLVAQQAMGKATPITCAVTLNIRAFLSIPTSWSRKKQLAAAVGEIVPTKRPDLDNLIKAIKDGANAVIWIDNSQVIDIYASKRYGAPRVEVEIQRYIANQ
ncbi:RusA family crossover junction endodeoxyribonuclease [Mycoavidus sp. SF9855]|uniref:RusA family crossover junction endodeoxyribonuclease n=1 Tax=Mycoavidus sp. SF9855 TaxID=2968475 RepID=UPI00211B8180|nr:RusA family crossover junction endodeoxyribonuclease [Mycoavidus sp. SF9855]UUM20948.1 RusA family crossover junction endodeoxyribonuclease [Mycoavidus sp. SF9855]